MKRIKFIALAVVALSVYSVAVSQETYDPNYTFKMLTNKYSKSEKDIVDAKKSVSPSTWQKRGQMMVEIYNCDQEMLNVGMNTTNLTIFLKDPKEKTTEQLRNRAYEAYIYDRLKVYVKDGAVQDWTVTQYVTDDPLVKAYEAYKKAIELDESGKIADKLTNDLKELVTKFETDGGLNFRREKYADAYNDFKYLTLTNELNTKENYSIDTSNIYNAGLAAVYAEMPKEAIEYLERAKELNYGGASVYTMLKTAYVEIHDTTKVLPLLKEGFEKFPESNEIIVELINYYLNRGIADQALEYLKIAKDADPENATYHFAEGTLYDKLGNREKTIEAYNNAIKYKSDWFDPYYNMGVIFYNSAVEIFDKASSIPPNKQKEYEAEMNRGNDELEKALPYMESALKIAEKEYNEKPNDGEIIKTYKGTLDTLKTIYFRLRTRNEDYQKKLDVVNEKLDKLS